MRFSSFWLVYLLLLNTQLVCTNVEGQQLTAPTTDAATLFVENEGQVVVEAEHFFEQSKTEKRAFYLTTQKQAPQLTPDGDPSHIACASNGAYLEILPDTRRNHGQKLIVGENFSNEPGKLAILSYKIKFKNAGRYYVWVRAHSTCSEDNGLHVGLDGEWPATGQRLQWCAGKHTWHWESKQRTEKNHCGEPHKIYLDIEKPGVHTVHFSMREDGFEFDQFLLTQNRELACPGNGLPASPHEGPAPKLFPYVDGDNSPPPPKPEAVKTKEQQKAKSNQKRIATKQQGTFNSGLVLLAKNLKPQTDGFYIDNDKWLAINPDQRKSASLTTKFPLPTGTYHITLRAIGEDDGQAKHVLKIGENSLKAFEVPLANETTSAGPKYHGRWQKVAIKKDQTISLVSNVASKNGKGFSRARWEAIVFRPANARTAEAAKPFIKPTLQEGPNQPSSKQVTFDDSISPTKPVSDLPVIVPRQPDGPGTLTVMGEQKLWHKMTFQFDGPYAHEQDNEPNPFLDYRMEVEVWQGSSRFIIPGYFAADGQASESSAESGTIWRAHFAPNLTGAWNYRATLSRGKRVAVDNSATANLLLESAGTFEVANSDKNGRDFRAHGRLAYVGKRYLQHMGTGKYFLKAGADAPETLLAFADFDGTVANKAKKCPLKKFEPHLQDWKQGDPTWQNGKGKGLIGAINYLSAKGCNAFSFLTYNAGGDGDNVWPYIQRDDKLHFDCSKLDQWGIVFDHGTRRGMYLHFKLQETENDDHRKGHKSAGPSFVPTSLDGGNLKDQRKVYLREIIARFGHNLALNWNLGEENTQSNRQQLEMINFIRDTDPYNHHVVIHTFPDQQDKVYLPLLGENSLLSGASLQNSSIFKTHSDTVKWVQRSSETPRPWVVAFDESGTAAHGQCPDLGYQGFDGTDKTGKKIYDQHAVRKSTLWGTLMGGGAGVEYYFGYQLAENDLICEDWRSRDQSWDYCRIALEFFNQHIPFEKMRPSDELVGNDLHDNRCYCLSQPGAAYLVYLPNGGSADLDLTDVAGSYSVHWFNPRVGGELENKEVREVQGGASVKLDAESNEDWAVLLKRK